MARSPPLTASRPSSPRPQTPGQMGSGTRSPEPAGPRSQGSGHGGSWTRWGTAACPPKKSQSPRRQGGNGKDAECRPLPPRSPNESCCKTLALKPFPCFRFVRTISAQSCLKTPILQLQESRSFKAPAARGPLPPVGCINSIYLNNQSPEPRDRDPLFLLSGSAVLPRTVNADGKAQDDWQGRLSTAPAGWGWGGVWKGVSTTLPHQ